MDIMKKGERRRGFDSFDRRISKKRSSAFIASCESCYFYNADQECTNPNVTEFDMVYEKNRTFCTFWTLNKPDEE